MNWKKIDQNLVNTIPELMRIFAEMIPMLISIAAILVSPVFVFFKVVNIVVNGFHDWTELIKVLLMIIILVYVERGFFKYIERFLREHDESRSGGGMNNSL